MNQNGAVQSPRIGICLWCLNDQTPGGLRAAREMGYDGVEMDMGLMNPARDLRDAKICAEYLRAAREAGLALPSLALNGIRMNDPAAEAEAREIVDASLEVAAQMEIPLLQMPSFFEGGMRNEAEFAATVKLLSYACDRAAALGVTVGTENQLDAEGNLRLLREVGRDNFRVYFDTANPKAMDGMDGVALLRALCPHVVETHVKDFSLGEARTCMPLGKGDCDFAQAAAVLKENGYTGWLVDENELSDDLLEADARLLRTMFP